LFYKQKIYDFKKSYQENSRKYNEGMKDHPKYVDPVAVNVNDVKKWCYKLSYQ